MSQARADLPTQDAASIHSVLDRVGSPKEIAASALADAAADPPSRRRPTGRRKALMAGIAALLLALGAIIYFAQRGSNVMVPDVVGSSKAAAEQVLSSAGLQYSVARRPFGPEESGATGTVLAQFPPAGTLEASGSAVTLDVKGITTLPSVVVPNVIGETVTVAFHQLRASGLAGGFAETCDRGNFRCARPKQELSSPNTQGLVRMRSSGRW